jgi:hypothetical protein
MDKSSILEGCNAQLLTLKALIRNLRLSGRTIDERSAQDCETARFSLYKALENRNKSAALEWCKSLAANLTATQRITKQAQILTEAQKALEEIRSKLDAWSED